MKHVHETVPTVVTVAKVLTTVAAVNSNSRRSKISVLHTYET